MLPVLTEAVVRALRAASGWAAQEGVSEVRPIDLFAALLEEEEGRPWALLSGAGVPLPAFRDQLCPARDPSALALLPLSEAAERIIDEARLLSRAVSAERAVSSECLLLALVQGDGELRGLLVKSGLDCALLEGAVLGESVPPLALDQPLALTEVTERVDAARVLDAASNRAREGLRVLEDYCRFCLDDEFLTGQLKQIRHDLREILGLLPGESLLQARETLRDVGVSISTETERTRFSLHDVVQASSKRLEEALRSMEEFGKLLNADFGIRLEQLRYRAYTIERALMTGTMARDRLANSRIQVLLSGSLCTAALDWTIAEAAAGGADIIQLREKTLSDRELLERSRNVRRWTRKAGVLFLVNDRPDIARLVEADGVHLGQDDMPVKEARRIAGPDLLIGVSTHTIEQVRQAILDGASYLGVGPLFPSKTKGFSDFPGLSFMKQAAAETSLPQFAIGGINADNLPLAAEAGARRIAISAAICQAEDPRRAAAELRSLLNS